MQVAHWQSPVASLHHVYRRSGVNNTHNSHVWADENPHATVESNFQQRFSVNVWCAVLDDQLIGPFILDDRLTGEVYLRFLQEELPQLLEDVPLDKRSIFFQREGAPPHSSRRVINFLNYRFPGQWIGCCGPHHWPARSHTFLRILTRHSAHAIFSWSGSLFFQLYGGCLGLKLQRNRQVMTPSF